VKRSEINALIEDAGLFIAQHRFHLPPFAAWTAEEWSQKGLEVQEIADHGLGWDVTDFGLGNYEQRGLLLFTIRNGAVENLARGAGKVYAEKLLIVNANQFTPYHYHFNKTEDIINRGGGTLCLQLHWADERNALSEQEITVSCDGVERKIEAGGIVRLSAGESITLPTKLYHAFWAEGSRVLAGEVSNVNDDANDNHFFEPIGRFPTVEEDVPAQRLLIGDYARYYPHAKKDAKTGGY
jgi:D-lyxose ketol-isomerase